MKKLFEANVRESDYVYRWGGDEFVILIPEATKEDAIKVGEKLQENLKNYPYPWQDEDDMTMSMSIGVASYPEFNTKQKLIQLL